jgi:uncharacterized protein (DUF2225 family)
MKVICINKTSWLFKNLVNLTPGKTYDVIRKNENQTNSRYKYKLMDDDGIIKWYDNDVVMDLEEWREMRLNEILE